MARWVGAVAVVSAVALAAAAGVFACTPSAAMGIDGVPAGSAPPQVLPGGSLTLHGTGFGVYENNRTVDIRWGFAGPSLGAAAVADDGSWTLRITIPTEARPGEYILNADAHDDAGFVVTDAVTVVAPVTAPPANSGAAEDAGSTWRLAPAPAHAHPAAAPSPATTARPAPTPSRPAITGRPRVLAPRPHAGPHHARIHVVHRVSSAPRLHTRPLPRLEPAPRAVVTPRHLRQPWPWRWLLLSVLLLLATAGGAMGARRRTPREPLDPVEAELQAMIADELQRRAEADESSPNRALRP